MIRKIPEFSKAGLLQSSLLIEKKSVRSTLNIFYRKPCKNSSYLNFWHGIFKDRVKNLHVWTKRFCRHDVFISRNLSFLPVEIPSYAKFVSPTHDIKFMLKGSKMTHRKKLTIYREVQIEAMRGRLKVKNQYFKASNKVQWNFLKSKYSERVYLNDYSGVQ